MTPRMEAIGAGGLASGYGSIPVLRGINLTVARGEIVAVVGRNGAGKTTLMKALMGLLPATTGAVRHDGEDVTAMPPELRARRGIGYVPQGRGMFPRLTVAETMAMGEMIARRRPLTGVALAYDLFPVLRGRAGQRAGTLSGGEQQMLAIARVLVGSPRLILLDEPSEGLAPSIAEEIAGALVTLNQQFGTTILMVEQNLRLIRIMAQRCLVMSKGALVAETAPSDLTGIQRWCGATQCSDTSSRLKSGGDFGRSFAFCQRRGEIPQKWALKIPHFVSDQSRP